MAQSRQKLRRTSSQDKTMSAQELLKKIQASNAKQIKVGGFDVDGVLRGKYISAKKLKSALESGFGFCDVIFGWDVTDTLYDIVKVTGWDRGYPDALAVVDPTTLTPACQSFGFSGDPPPGGSAASGAAVAQESTSTAKLIRPADLR